MSHHEKICKGCSLPRELEITEDLLKERNRVLDAIPSCPSHGSQCIPHALDWIKERKNEQSSK